MTANTLQKFFNFLDTEIAPQADLLDKDSNSLSYAFEQMVRLNLFGMNIPAINGGLELDKIGKHLLARNIARSSGALNLLQLQYQGAMGTINANASERFKSTWLNLGLSGKCRIGVGISHLHEIGKKTVSGIEYPDHYSVTGNIRYVTGDGFFTHVMIGFVTGNNEYMGLIPWQNNPLILNQTPIDLIAAKSTNTCSFYLDNYSISKEMICFQKPLGTFHEQSIRGQHLVSNLIGLALAVFDLITTSTLFNTPQVQRAYHDLYTKLNHYEEELIQLDLQQLTAPLRVKLLRLINDSLLLASQLFRGAISRESHPLNRLKNEVLLWSVVGAEEEMLDATCANISYRQE